MLRWRLILGFVFVSALVMLCVVDCYTTPGNVLAPLAILISMLGVNELIAMLRTRGHNPHAGSICLGTLIAIVLASAPRFLPAAYRHDTILGQLGWLALAVAAGTLPVVLAEIRRFRSPGTATTNLAAGVFAVAYIGGAMGFIVQLRLLDIHAPTTGRLGMLALISLIATVKMSDTGQYMFGRLFGKHKLSPIVSPGKTWEGAGGGLLVAVLTAWFVFTVVARWMLGDAAPHVSAITIILFGITVAAAGIIGDLTESLLKRDAGVKDSSTWMPGFGGVLDLLDSLLGAAPVAYAIWALAIL